MAPVNQTIGEIIGEMPAIPAIEEVAHRLLAETRSGHDRAHGERPRLVGVCVMANAPVEALARVHAFHGSSPVRSVGRELLRHTRM
jgi:hypothetical protein